MALISYTYFEKTPFLIDGTQNDYVIDDINAVIDYFEPIICRKMIGETLYNELIAGLSIVPIADKWTALKALLVLCSQAYCYIEYVKSNQTNTLQTGESTQVDGNLQKVSPFQKLVFANNVISDTQIKIDELCSDNVDYESYKYETIINKVNGFGF